MLPAAPPYRRKGRPGTPLPPKIAGRWSRVIELLHDEPVITDSSGVIQTRYVSMTPAAAEAWWTWYEAHQVQSQELHGDELAAFCKLEAHVPRVALLFALLNWAIAGKADTLVITADDVRRACVLTEFFEHEARRLDATLAEDHHGQKLRQFAETIQGRFGGSVRVRDWQR